MLTESRANQVVKLKATPADVAEACQDVLNKLGRVKTVSRETGTIAGKFSPNPLANPVFVNIAISRSGDYTEVMIQTERKEGLLTQGGAQKGLASFLDALGKHPKIKAGVSVGW